MKPSKRSTEAPVPGRGRVPAAWDYHTQGRAWPRCWASREQPLGLPLVGSETVRRRLYVCAMPLRDGAVRYAARVQVGAILIENIASGYVRGPLRSACEWLDELIPEWVQKARKQTTDAS